MTSREVGLGPGVGPELSWFEFPAGGWKSGFVFSFIPLLCMFLSLIISIAVSLRSPSHRLGPPCARHCINTEQKDGPGPKDFTI